MMIVINLMLNDNFELLVKQIQLIQLNIEQDLLLEKLY